MSSILAFMIFFSNYEKKQAYDTVWKSAEYLRHGIIVHVEALYFQYNIIEKAKLCCQGLKYISLLTRTLWTYTIKFYFLGADYDV